MRQRHFLFDAGHLSHYGTVRIGMVLASVREPVKNEDRSQAIMTFQAAENTERRADMRQRVLKGAKIRYNKGYAAAEGVVRNSSAGGIKVVCGRHPGPAG